MRSRLIAITCDRAGRAVARQGMWPTKVFGDWKLRCQFFTGKLNVLEMSLASIRNGNKRRIYTPEGLTVGGHDKMIIVRANWGAASLPNERLRSPVSSLEENQEIGHWSQCCADAHDFIPTPTHIVQYMVGG